MKNKLAFCFIFNVMFVGSLSATGYSTQTLSEEEKHNQWLKQKFQVQHQQITPVVAVADMFFACNDDRKFETDQYKVSFLVETMDKEVLAEKLEQCLGKDNLNSDAAVNYGLVGCFHEQLAHLPEAERLAKMVLVKKAIASLSREERQISLTQCVTEQAISYLK